jgi:hypothetical protein
MTIEFQRRPQVIVWGAGQDWAAALRQWRPSLVIEEPADYEEFCKSANRLPYAVSLWEVNLSNWKERAGRLIQFRRRHFTTGLAVATSGVIDEIGCLFQEVGAFMVMKDRLAAAFFLRALDRSNQWDPTATPNWRDHVATKIAWLDDHNGSSI